jgi:hypothetical protein
MLNPSAAGVTDPQGRPLLDPTVRNVWRHLVGVSVGVGAAECRISEVTILNAFDLRATDPQDMQAGRAVINGRLIGEGLPARSEVWAAAMAQQLRDADLVVCGWGVARVDAQEVLRLVPPDVRTYSWGQTKDGHPRHPCYLRAADTLSPWPGHVTTTTGIPDPSFSSAIRRLLGALYVGTSAPILPRYAETLRRYGLISDHGLTLRGEILAVRWGLWPEA